MTALRSQNLCEVAARVPVPAYDRSEVTAGIAHVGVGGFHRAHQAMYLDRLMNDGQAMDWGTCGIGLLPGDRKMGDVLARQDMLYTLVEKHPDGTLAPRVIGSIVEFVHGPDDPWLAVERLCSPDIRIVSLTITEGGYQLDPVSGEFDSRSAALQADLRPGAAPATVFGLVTEALARRRDRGLAPFTVMSCDNIPGNGDVARRMFSAFAILRDPALGDWVSSEVAFPSSMVDRITPVTTDDDRALLADRFGIADEWPVVCEPYVQWALEDRFSVGRPPLEQVGVQLVDDADPFDLMKLRLLNGSHQALAYLGYLAGHRYVHEAAQDPRFVEFLQGYMAHEVRPTLLPVPGVDLSAYSDELISRFANPHVRDALARICVDASDRIPKFVLPTIRDQLGAGGEIRRAALVVAAWARYCEGTDEAGQPIEVVDRLSDELTAAASRQREDPDAFIGNRELFGSLADDPRFGEEYRRALGALRVHGARATMELAGR